jgi:hypothetical protein
MRIDESVFRKCCFDRVIHWIVNGIKRYPGNVFAQINTFSKKIIKKTKLLLLKNMLKYKINVEDGETNRRL